MRKGRLASAVAGAVAGLLVAGIAVGASDGPTPANKVVAGASETEVFSPKDGPVVLASGTMRTSKPTDLLIQTSLECSILTKLTTGPSADAGATDTAKADATIRGWVVIDDDANIEAPADETGAAERVVSIESESNPPQDPEESGSGSILPLAKEGNPTLDDSATYCNRTYERTVTDGENALDGIDEETDYINTKTANAFNWVLLNAGSGIHYVRWMGEIDGGSAATCSKDSTEPAPPVQDEDGEDTANNACTSAYVGNRTIIIEPTKMANDAVVGPSGS
jgi:hypothetical protein